MAAVRKRFWTLLVRREGQFLPEFDSFVFGEAIAKMGEWRRKGVAPPEQYEDLLKGGPRAFRTVDDFGDANPRGQVNFMAVRASPSRSSTITPRRWGYRRGSTSLAFRTS